MVWLFVGLIALSATGVALSTQTVASATMPDADGIAIFSGIVGFLSWGFWSFGSLTVVVATSGGLAQAKMPGLTMLGVALAILCGYIALTGPAEIIASRYKDPRAEDL